MAKKLLYFDRMSHGVVRQLIMAVLLSIFYSASAFGVAERLCMNVFLLGDSVSMPRPTRTGLHSDLAAFQGWRPGHIGETLGFVYDFGLTRRSYSDSWGMPNRAGEFVIQRLLFGASDLPLRIERARFIGSGVGSAPAGGVSDEYKDFVGEFTRFVIGSQRRRNVESKRPRSWSDETLKQVESDIQEFADDTTWIQVKADEPPRNTLGTLKFVSVGQGQLRERLPLEIEYGVELPRNGGAKIEIGNYVVDPDFNGPVTIELLLQISLKARELLRRPGHEPHRPVFYIAADSVLARFYRSVGFSERVRVQAQDQSPWIVLEASAEGLLEGVAKLAQFNHRLRVENTSDRVRSVDQLTSLAEFQSTQEVYVFPYVEYSPGSRRDFGGVQVSISERIQKSVRSAGEPSASDARRIFFSLTKSLDFNTAFYIPEKYFPLEEGMVFQPDPGFRATYRGGKLLLEAFHRSVPPATIGRVMYAVELEADPALKSISTVSYWQDQGLPSGFVSFVAKYKRPLP